MGQGYSWPDPEDLKSQWHKIITTTASFYKNTQKN